MRSVGCSPRALPGLCQAQRAELPADVAVSPDFRHLEPMVAAACRELAAAGVSERPEVVVADASYWRQAQMRPSSAKGAEY